VQKQDGATDGDPIPWLQSSCHVSSDLLPIDKSAVGAAQIRHRPALRALLETGVLPGDEILLQRNVTGWLATDNHRGLLQGKIPAGQWALLTE
jgi:hypothetical protein